MAEDERLIEYLQKRHLAHNVGLQNCLFSFKFRIVAYVDCEVVLVRFALL